MATQYNPPDYYLTDELFSDEHKIIRSSVRDWVNKSVLPIIEDYNQKHECPLHLIKEMGELGLFGTFIPEKYGCPGLDHISWNYHDRA